MLRHELNSMAKNDRATFTLEDIRAIRYLVLALGGVGIGMLLITDRDSPVMVVSFITVVTVVPLAAIYLLRRFARQRKPDHPSEPSQESVLPRDAE
jgi:hypothetical protein